MNSLLQKGHRRHYNTLGVGDRSGSKSEDYVLNVFQLQPDGSEKRIYTLRSGGFGQYKDETKSFPRQHSYSFQIDWQGTNNQGTSGSADPDGADFDYHLVVDPQSGHESHTLIDAYDPREKTVDTENKLRDPEDINPADDGDDDVTEFLTTHEPKRVLLLRAGILVDANRDGQFSAEDEGKITQEKPWRIWVNDDDDSGETGGKDIAPGTGTGLQANFYTGYVNGVRDLVDFFPVTLQIKEALRILPTAKYDYILKMTDGPILAPIAAAWLEDVDLTNHYGVCDGYQKIVEKAQEAANKSTNHITRAGIPLPTSLTDQLHNGDGMMILEGRIATTDAAITLAIKNKETGATVTEAKLPIVISKVDDMFRNKWLDEGLDGDTAGGIPAEPSGYPDSETNGKTFLFLHGYNVSGAHAKGWHAEAFKRLYQSGSRARFIGVTWRGNESQIAVDGAFIVAPDYWRNVHNAFRTSKSLANFVNGISGTKTIAAHSLGNMVCSSAIHDHGMNVAQYYMIDAAVPVEAYSGTIDNAAADNMRNPAWATYDKRLWASHWWQTFPVGHPCRQKAKWTGRFAPFPNAYNFYSTGEEVLEHAAGLEPGLDLSGRLAWTKQEMTKGFSLFSGGGIGEITASGGWNWNQYWFTRDYTLEPDGIHYSDPRKRTPAETTSITDAQLRTKPFFEPFHNDDFHKTDKQEAAANNYEEVSRLLAESIPAISYPAGSTPIGDFEDRNFNMHTAFKNGWPTSRAASNNNWRHSDVREVAYLYIYALYDKFCEIAELETP